MHGPAKSAALPRRGLVAPPMVINDGGPQVCTVEVDALMPHVDAYRGRAGPASLSNFQIRALPGSSTAVAEVKSAKFER